MRSFQQVCTLVLVSILATAAQAAPNLLVTQVSANAQGDTRRPVVIEVTVRNTGNEASLPGEVDLVLTPKVSMGSRPNNPGGGQTMYDPYKLAQPLPPIEPNKDLVVKFNTPYDTKSSFKGQHGTFRASNIDPTGSDVVVNMAATLRK